MFDTAKFPPMETLYFQHAKETSIAAIIQTIFFTEHTLF